MTRASLHLTGATFYGQVEHEHAVADFSLAVRTADPTRVVERHMHEDAHFVLVLSGAYHTVARGAATTDQPLLIYNPPGTTHEDHFAARHGRFHGRFFTLSLPTAAAPAILGEPLDAAHPVAVTHPDAAAIARRLVHECCQWDGDSPIVAASLGLELFGPALRRVAPIRAVPSWLPRTLDLLRDRCTEPLSIRDVADAAGVHPVYLARAFRRVVGCSPGTFLRRARVDRAIAWLRGSHRSIADIAAATGYADQSHLHRAVLERTGQRPSALRPSAPRRAHH